MYRKVIAKKENAAVSAQRQPDAPLKSVALKFINSVAELYRKTGRMHSSNVPEEKDLYQQWHTRYKYDPEVRRELEKRGVDVNRTLEIVQEEETQADFIDNMEKIYKETGRMPSSNVPGEKNLYWQWHTRYKYDPEVRRELEKRGVDVNRTLEIVQEEKAQANFIDNVEKIYKKTGRMPDQRVPEEVNIYHQWIRTYKYNPEVRQQLKARGLCIPEITWNEQKYVKFIDSVAELYRKTGRMPSSNVPEEVSLYQQWHNKYKYNPEVRRELEKRGVDVNRTLRIVQEEETQADFIDNVEKIYKETGRVSNYSMPGEKNLYWQWYTRYKYDPEVRRELEKRGVDVNRTLRIVQEEETQADFIDNVEKIYKETGRISNYSMPGEKNLYWQWHNRYKYDPEVRRELEKRGVDVNRTLRIVQEEETQADFIDNMEKIYKETGRMPNYSVPGEKNLYWQWHNRYKYDPEVRRELEKRGVDVNRTLRIVQEEETQADFIDNMEKIYKETGRMPNYSVPGEKNLYWQWHNRYKYDPEVRRELEKRGVDVNRTLRIVQEEETQADFIDNMEKIYKETGRMPNYSVPGEKNLYWQWHNRYKYDPEVRRELEKRGVDVNRTLRIVQEEETQADFIDNVEKIYKETGRMPNYSMPGEKNLYQQWHNKYKYDLEVRRELEKRGVALLKA
ncbi:hypothetical protein NO1_0504 [Candidatus Termititenax aidoneus]|uniref:Uncharacterized protein n=1 Tax=Termititenax aidoneus TaxID=2218524 RepID=A0A388T9Y7_TERA1|nr:hypothetical protein NO1_0504 [Candidatus Termititenax aidoneus]